MKIVYMIHNVGLGKGGHYYSLLETARQLAKHEDVKIISIGSNSSPVLSLYEGTYNHIVQRVLGLTIIEVTKYIKREKPSIIHAFDIESFLFARLASLFTKTPVVLTRCGGANPTRYYPYNDEIILYSKENQDFLEKKRKYSKVNFSLIPNRVNIKYQDDKRIQELSTLLRKDFLTMLRIARISSAYEKSILQSILLVNKLNEASCKVQLVIVGIIQDDSVYENIIKYESENVIFVTNERYTINSSQLIDIADIVVGTGRGFMEAALLNKIMLASNSNLDIPILITKERVLNVFSKNFSQRYVADINTDDAFLELTKLIKYELVQECNEHSLLDFANNNFSADKIYEKHIIVYKRAKYAKLKLLDILKNTGVILKSSNNYLRGMNKFFKENFYR